MNRLMLMAAVVALLAAGAAARAAEKEAPIDWPARAATVKVGMTRAEVEKILPRWSMPPGIHRFYDKPDVRKPSVFSQEVDPSRELHRTGLGTNTLALRERFYDGGTHISLGSRGPGLISERYRVSEDWVVTVNYNDRDSKGIKRFSSENRLVAPVKIEAFDKLFPPKPTP